MDWYEPEVRALEETLRLIQVPEDPAVFYGSSSIRMWSDLTTDLDCGRVLNLGFGGSTLAACVHFFDRLLPPLKPASLVVYAGDNDIGDGRTAEQVWHSFRQLANLVAGHLGPIPFGFISIKLSPSRTALRKTIQRANQLIDTEIAAHPHAYFIDVYEAMLNGNGQPRAELFLEDGLHLSRTGYRLWAELLDPYRNRIFTPPCP